MAQPSTDPAERELVLCHQCENEWYRDEHGLICPDCQSDFTEIIDPNHDPRLEAQREEEMMQMHGDHFAPDPDEDDIDHFGWQGQHPSQNTARQGQAQGQEQGPTGLGTGLFGILGQAIRAALDPEATTQQRPSDPTAQQRDDPSQPQPNNDDQQNHSPRMHTTIHRYSGGGGNFSYTMTTSTSSNLFPRNANEPQAFQQQPEDLEALLNRVAMNIGVPVMVRVGGGPAGSPFGGPFGGAGAGASRMPMNLMSLFGGGQMGDAVFSQEALDRVITQLMEQNQSGHAPGPASEQAIESLPTRKITEKDLGEDSNGKAECSICMDEVPVGDEVTVLPCSHWFHHDCVKAWLSEHDTCPHCRQGIMPRDTNGNENGEQNDSTQARQSGQAPLHDMHSPAYHTSSIPGSFPFPQGPQQQQQQHDDAYSTFGQTSSSSSRTAAPQTQRPESRRNPSDIFSRMRDVFGGGGGGGANNDHS